MRIRYDRHATIIDAWNNPALAAICFRIFNNTAESIDTNSVLCQPLFIATFRLRSPQRVGERPFRRSGPVSSKSLNFPPDGDKREPKGIGNIKDISIGNFHVYSDKVVPADYSQVMIEAFTKARDSPRQTGYQGGGHNSWSQPAHSPTLSNGCSNKNARIERNRDRFHSTLIFNLQRKMPR